MSSASGNISITRVIGFSAAHRYHSDELSEDENRRVFGKCNRPHGHGHNYRLEVTVSGETRVRQQSVTRTLSARYFPRNVLSL